jgi:mono/diheme cytochrome c family protein
MLNCVRRLVDGAVLCLFCFAPAVLTADDLPTSAYNILQKNCVACHGAAKTSGLDLRTKEGLTAGGDHGRVIAPFDPEESRLLKLVSHEATPSMPPGRRKLSDEDIETLRNWIEGGAPYPKIEAPQQAESATLAKLEERPITPEERAYWAFQKPKAVVPPHVSENPIDAFLLSAMKAKGLKPAPRADRRTLVRRAFLDLLGVPPTPDEVNAFVNDKSLDAWPKLIDKLLASPHYGERWARHWLDLVRYADSEGYEFDIDRPQAWRYRDYVVNSFNQDKPYDRFVKEQLAGDECTYTDPQEKADAMIATGFLRLGASTGGGERGRQDGLDDIVSTTSMTFLGMTVGCARCHNHKFDPIPQKDYYRIQAVFFSTRPTSYPLVSKDVIDQNRAEMNRIMGLQRPLRKAKSDIEEPFRKQLMDEAISKLPEYMQVAWKTPADKRTDGQKLNVQQITKTLTDDTLSMKITDSMMAAMMPPDVRKKYDDLNNQIEALDKQRPKPYDTAMAVTDTSRTPQPSYFLHRGSADARGSLMTPGVLTVASATEYTFPTPPPDAQTTWRRRGFAEWVTSPENPLAARVMVNRIWQHHFGEGIVRTPSNFGKLGGQPSHPELLDWLAIQFVEHGWSIKSMHRLMMNTEAYQMASKDVPANLEIDADNRYFWRMPRERLEAEIIRDEILSAAGTLDQTLGGPGILPFIPPELVQASSKRTWKGKAEDDPSTFRRSLYVFSKRSIRYPLFEAYDQPNLVNSCDRRNRSTIAPQALIMMNDNFLVLQSKHFAERLRKEAGDNSSAQVERAFQLALGRAPTGYEKDQALTFIKTSRAGLEEFCQAIFNLNEFVYRL